MIFSWFFRLFGWRIRGGVSSTVRKAVLCVCPHKANSDFFVGLGARASLKRKIGYLGKEELFRPPFGFIFRLLGGIPVKRDKRHNLVEDFGKAIKESEDMLFALAPEGTRKNVARLKTGFYYMALAGEIPIIPVGFDYLRKEVVFGEPFLPSGDFQMDMQKHFVPFFKGIAKTDKDWLKNYENGVFDEQ
ncbi:1-acyl-sn-glycerol-3-phosphate acyltransferase [Marinilongibacter aquaticus]|uniref:1-acyl-sn-glycerol-3-phosphate acyltransferase n=1 Tax=Marinilongibacter aquaticus TaxID=2975157 RepID=UPI0021BDC818|nr:1-acyl-sn-glycerol-3-phosphate acyltransferase [Marinilongibacter aquaticus]UBM59792.1 1-acyl-sn-glycerol-3-phosphate acyltransferase [Marinilongibacter aquaticus]